MQKYLDEFSFPAQSYKTRHHYENILIRTSSAEFEHFKKNGKADMMSRDIAYSKILIRSIISAEEWGLSTHKLKTYVVSTQQNPIQYSYWDYVDAFSKVFYFENEQHKHSWFVKIAATVLNKEIPTWFIIWWNFFGPNPTILPEPFKGLYAEWLECSPRIQNLEDQQQYVEGTASMYFFLEFSIPWIVRWIPEVGYAQQHIPCLKRTFFTKFWHKMIQIDQNTKQLHSQQVVSEIETKLVEYKKQIKEKKEKLLQDAPKSSFEQFVNKLQTENSKLSSQDIMVAYMDQIKSEMVQFTRKSKSSSPSEMSMEMSQPQGSRYFCLAGQSQDPEEEEERDYSLEDVFESMKDALKQPLQIRSRQEGSSSSPRQD